MPRSQNNRGIEIPRWLKVELDAQAERLGVTPTAYAARLLEEGCGIRNRPATWKPAARPTHRELPGQLAIGE